MVTLSKDCIAIAFFIAKVAPSFLAKFLLEIPLFTSKKIIDSKRLDTSLVLSRIKPNQPFITSPQPTSPIQLHMTDRKQ